MYKKNLFLQTLVLSFLCIVSFAEEKQKPNVVFIIVDDLNDWIGVMGGHPQTKTQYLDALAVDGVFFTNAHSNAHQCRPYQGSLLLGLYPKSTGSYFNSLKWMPFYGDQPTQGITSPIAPKNPFIFHLHFKEYRYRVGFGGKVAHGNSRDIIRNADEYLARAAYARGNFTDEKTKLWGEGGPHNHAVKATYDYNVAQWAIGEWREGLKIDKPLLMTVGFYRPHRPFNALKAYFEKFRLEGIQLPLVRTNNLHDPQPYGKALACSNVHKDLFKPLIAHEQILHQGGEKE